MILGWYEQLLDVFLQSEVTRVSLYMIRVPLLIKVCLRIIIQAAQFEVSFISMRFWVIWVWIWIPLVSVGVTLSVHVCCHPSAWQYDINIVRVCVPITSHNPACSLPWWCVDVQYRDAFNPGVFRTSIMPKETKTVRMKLVFVFSFFHSILINCSASLQKCLLDVCT